MRESHADDWRYIEEMRRWWNSSGQGSMGDVYVNESLIITLKMAEEIAKQHGVVLLDKVKEISEEVARVMWGGKYMLSLKSLETLDIGTARELSSPSGNLFLDGLVAPGIEVLKILAAHQGTLSLGGLKILDFERASALAEHAAPLYLNGVRSFSDNKAAEALIAHKGKSLSLRSLVASEETLGILSAYKGHLGLRSSAPIETIGRKSQIPEDIQKIEIEKTTRMLDPERIGKDADWEGNNAAFTCPVCGKIYIVSDTRMHINAETKEKGYRQCPSCGKSIARIVGGRKSGGKASITW